MKKLIIMIVSSFVIQYFIMPFVMINNFTYFTFSLGKVYISLLMGFLMGIVEMLMHDMRYNSMSTNYYIGLVISSIICIYLYRLQIGITDAQYLEEMIEHHSMALLTSGIIEKKSDNYEVVALSKNIIQVQNDDILKMRDLLHI